MKVGLVLNSEQEPDQEAPRWADIRAVAQRAEAVGFDSVWLVDHFLWESDPWERPGATKAEALGVWEAWTTLAAVAAVTSRIALGTLVTCTAYRNPALLAKMAATVDEVSGGRLILGLGAGDLPSEHVMYGFEWDRPVARFEEALHVIVPLLRSGAVDHSGVFYAAADCRLLPPGPRPTGPPILIGCLGTGPRMLRLVAQYADLWNGSFVDDSAATRIPSLRHAVDDACRKHGRDPSTLRRSVTVAIALGGPMSKQPGIIVGSESDVARSLSAFAEEGIDELQVRLFPTDPDTVASFEQILARVHKSAAA